ncbi:MAG: carbohydrate binding domain-containing protein [Verrucomicrobiota bacterium]
MPCVLKVLPLLCVTITTVGAATVMVEDFEKAELKPKVWVVNVPNENASVDRLAGNAHDGESCLKLRHRFLGEGNFQYLGIPHKVRILSPVHRLRFWLKGDDSKGSYGVQISDASREAHQFGKNSGQGGIIDFKGWKEVVVDLNAGHETWDGDKNGKLAYPITGITLTVGQPTAEGKPLAAEGDLFFDSISVDSDASVAETLGSEPGP